MENKKLPTIQELHSDTEMAIKENAFNVLMNNPPKKEWIKKHPHGNFNYIPIERVEWLLTYIFTNWHAEIREVKLIANSISVTVRLHYKHPVSGDTFQDGVGAAPLQTEKGAGAIDFNQMKTNAVQLAAPSAESYAIKEAEEKIGKLFGKDINRKDTMNYDFGNQFDVLDEVTADKVNLIEGLIRTSTYNDEEKARMESDLMELTNKEASDMINNLYQNQMSGMEKENYGNKAIQEELNKKEKE